MNLDNDYDNDGNNIVPCPICLNVNCPANQYRRWKMGRKNGTKNARQ